MRLWFQRILLVYLALNVVALAFPLRSQLASAEGYTASLFLDATKDPASGGWLDTGIDVSVDDVVKISADGAARFAPNFAPTNPDGFYFGDNGKLTPDTRSDVTAYVPELPVGTLIGAIDTGYGDKQPFKIGTHYDNGSSEFGRLLLAYNDVPGGYDNNSGGYEVSIEVIPGVTTPFPSGWISGTVTGNDGHPIQGASILVSQDGYDLASSASDPDGKYEIPSLFSGTYSVTVTKEGYLEQRIESFDVLDGETVLDIVMQPANIVVPIQSITLSQSEITLHKSTSAVQHESVHLTAEISPANASNRTILWSSDTPTVATVDDTGLVTALNTGQSTITARSADGQAHAHARVVVKEEQTEIPIIQSISPASGTSVGANPTISVFATDNDELTQVELFVRPASQANAAWASLGSKQPNSRAEVVSFLWNTDGLGDGDYELMAKATDASDNVSAAKSVLVALRLSPPDTPDLEAKAIAWGADLNWPPDGQDTIDHYRILRSTTSGGPYQAIAQTKETAYSDTALDAGQSYFYVLEAVDKHNNVSRSQESLVIPTDVDVTAPAVNAGEDRTVAVDDHLEFQADVKDNQPSLRYHWDFGNGDVSDAEKPVYAFDREGTYTVTLTVTDPAGNHASDQLIVTVSAQETVGKLQVSVVDDATGQAVPNAVVMALFDDGSSQKIAADSQGRARIVTDHEAYRIAAYAQDYKPAMNNVAVNVPSSSQLTLRLQKGALVDGSLNVKRMSPAEIELAGIDLSNPNNQWVYRFEIHLHFLPEPIEFAANASGQFVLGEEQLPDVISTPGGGSLHPYLIPSNHPGVAPALAYLVLPGEASWLKEFFEVGLTIQNMADSQFSLDDASVSLNVPDGLTLMTAPTFSWDTIAGQEEEEARWIVRGDKKGMYNIGAEFRGMLQPFDEEVRAVFGTANPFRVWGDDALKMTVYAQSKAEQGKPYNVRFDLTNVSDTPVYNLNFKLQQDGQRNIEYITEYGNQHISELGAGTTASFEYTLIPAICGCLDLPGSYAATTGGNAEIQTEIKSMEAPLFDERDALLFRQSFGKDSVTLTWDKSPDPNVITYKIYRLTHDGTNSLKLMHTMTDKQLKDVKKTFAGKLYYEIELNVEPNENDRYIVSTVYGDDRGEQWEHLMDWDVAPPAAPPVVFPSGGLDGRSVSLLRTSGPNGIEFTITPTRTGTAWENNYDVRLTNNDEEHITVAWSDGNDITYSLNAAGQYVSDQKDAKYDHILRSPDGSLSLTRPNHEVYRFNQAGLLVEKADANGLAQTLDYDQDKHLMRITDTAFNQSVDIAYDRQGMISRIQDNRGRQAELAYNDRKQITSLKDEWGTVINYAYDEQDRLSEVKEAAGQAGTRYEYDDKGRISAEFKNGQSTPGTYTYQRTADGDSRVLLTDTQGSTRELIYNPSGQLLSSTDAEKHAVVYNYDEQGNMTRSVNALGKSSSYQFDDRGNMKLATNPTGQTVAYTYDDRGLATSETDHLGGRTVYAYNGAGDMTSVTTPDGHMTSMAYDDQHNLISVTSPSGATTTYEYRNGVLYRTTDAEGGTTTYAYDDYGNLASVTDALGHATSYVYDAFDRATQIVDPLGNKQTFEYDSHNRVVQQTDANGHATRYEYTADGLIDNSTDALNGKTTYRYDGNNQLIEAVDAAGHATKWSYDDNGRVIQETDALGRVQKVDYDAYGNVIDTVDSTGLKHNSRTYDDANNLISEKDEAGSVQTYEYDALNRLIKSVDPLNRVTEYRYDAAGRQVAAVDPLHGLTGQSFDADGNRTGLTDPNGNATAFGYDAAGRVTSIQYAAGGKVSYAYDRAGQMILKTNARGERIASQYDAAGRLTKETSNEGAAEFDYDAVGNLLNASDPRGEVRYQYDALDRIVGYRDIYGNQIGYDYDEAGNLRTLTYPDGKKVSYAYDALSRLISVTDWANRTTSYSYTERGKLYETKRPDGSTERREYDLADQLIRLVDLARDGTVIGEFNYRYDRAGNVVSERNANEPADSQPASSLAMTYGADNRMLTYGGLQLSFDADGNMTEGPLAGGKAQFQYDSRNRLVQAGTSSYQYDVNGSRTAVTDQGKTTRYVVDPRSALTQVLMETNEQGRPTAYYVYGLGLIGAEDSEGNYTNYHFDRRGSTAALTDQRGAVTDRFAYDPYGKLIQHEGKTSTPFLFNGRYGVIADANGLYYMQSRYYSPDMKRFVNQDVLFGDIASSPSMNRYAFANGQPITMLDPFGLCAIEDLWSEVLGGISDWISDHEGTLSIIATVMELSLIPPLSALGAGINTMLYANEAVRTFYGRNPYGYAGLALDSFMFFGVPKVISRKMVARAEDITFSYNTDNLIKGAIHTRASTLAKPLAQYTDREMVHLLQSTISWRTANLAYRKSRAATDNLTTVWRSIIGSPDEKEIGGLTSLLEYTKHAVKATDEWNGTHNSEAYGFEEDFSITPNLGYAH